MNFIKNYPNPVNRDLFRSELSAFGCVFRPDHFEVLEALPEDETTIDSIIANHDHTQQTAEQQQDNIETGAKSEIQAIPNYVSWTGAEAEAWIQANVNDLATAKTVLIALAKMTIALRNKTFPDLQG